jgi:hypothetical protein
MFLVVVVVQIRDEVFVIVIWSTGPGRVEYGVSLLTGDKYLIRAISVQAIICASFKMAI